MTEADQALQNVFREDLIEEKKDQARGAYEERVVKKILLKAGLADQTKAIALEMRNRTGQARVNLTGFYELYPTFPTWLQARKLPYVHQLGLPDLFNKFCSTPIFKAWEETWSECPYNEKWVGLVFDWPGVSGTQMIIHNDYQARLDDNNVRITRVIGKKDDRLLFIATVEQLDRYLDRILEVWAH